MNDEIKTRDEFFERLAGDREKYNQFLNGSDKTDKEYSKSFEDFKPKQEANRILEESNN